MKAILKSTDSDIEEQVTLLINGREITCFAGVCPYQIQVGHEYSVAFEMNVFDDYYVTPSASQEQLVTQVDNGFAYLLSGKLDGNTVDCGIPFEDDVLLSDFGYLENQFVNFKVDRIDVEFL